MSVKIKWLGHAGFLIDAQSKVYIDPYKIGSGLPIADIILVTHNHYDHCSPEDIKKVYVEKKTTIIGPSSIKKELNYPVMVIKPNQNISIKNIEIKAVYAYNPQKQFHPKSEENLGYVLNLENIQIYHSGDTDFIPEMKEIKADICLLPVGGTYTMDVKEALKAVEVISPKIAIPMHWGTIIGSKKDAEEFVRLCKTETKLLTKDEDMVCN